MLITQAEVDERTLAQKPQGYELAIPGMFRLANHVEPVREREIDTHVPMYRILIAETHSLDAPMYPSGPREDQPCSHRPDEPGIVGSEAFPRVVQPLVHD